VIDDLGAIIMIAIFYTTGLSLMNLSMALGIFVFMLIIKRFKVYNLIPYLVCGLLMWYFMLHSGVHATITGVLLAFAIPFGDGGEKSPSFILQHFLHKPVAFIILPLFAAANTCIAIGNDWLTGLSQSYSLGIIAGLVFGKPIGIWLFSYAAVCLGLSVVPSGLKWINIFGAGLLGGIGFTMSIFITLLAFENSDVINGAKIAILIASFIAGLTGYLWLKLTLKTEIEDNE
jgi:NhaA family Na+:H+ antiporter